MVLALCLWWTVTAAQVPVETAPAQPATTAADAPAAQTAPDAAPPPPQPATAAADPPARTQRRDGAIPLPDNRDDRARAAMASLSVGILGVTAVAALLNAGLATVASVTGGVSILYRPLTLASGSFTPFNFPGGKDTFPVAWAFTTVELSFLILAAVAMSSLPTWGLLSSALFVLAMVTVFPDTRAAGMVRFVLRAVAMHSVTAALLSLTGAPLLAVPALFSVLLILVPTTSGNLPPGAGRLTGFWGPPLLVAALTLVAAGAVLTGVAVDLTLVSRSPAPRTIPAVPAGR